jgi:hypothetical protein
VAVKEIYSSIYRIRDKNRRNGPEWEYCLTLRSEKGLCGGHTGVSGIGGECRYTLQRGTSPSQLLGLQSHYNPGLFVVSLLWEIFLSPALYFLFVFI